MEEQKRWIWIGAVDALIFFAWMFRYDTKDGTAGTSLVTDRWMGTVYRCGVYINDKMERGCKQQF